MDAEGSQRSGDVDRIREIIFGEAMRGYEQRIAELEALLAARMHEAHTGIEQARAQLDAKVAEMAVRMGDLEQRAEQLRSQLQSQAGEAVDRVESSGVALLSEVDQRIAADRQEAEQLLASTLENMNLRLADAAARADEHQRSWDTDRARQLDHEARDRAKRDELAETLMQLAARLRSDDDSST